jgi:putative hydrolase of the HAD superfamily
MRIKAVIFDVNGTLVNIHTDEEYKRVYKSISKFLGYQGLHCSPLDIKNEYFRIQRAQREQRRTYDEHHPEIDAVEIWREFLRCRLGRDGWLPAGKLEQLPLFLAEMFRSISRRRLELYPGVRRALDSLRNKRRLGVVSDAQAAWARPELRMAGVEHYFETIVVSGEHGFRKPDRRIFELALARLDVAPWEAIYVGNDIYRDVYGPQRLGMKTVLYLSDQGRRRMDGVAPDYLIRHFDQLGEAVRFLEREQ